MELVEALSILAMLADGKDPETRMTLAKDSTCRKPRVVLALHLVVKAVATAQLDRLRKAPKNTNKYWSRSEETMVCDELTRGMMLAEIAKAHLRSVASIVARLVKLGRIAPGPAVRKRGTKELALIFDSPEAA